MASAGGRIGAFSRLSGATSQNNVAGPACAADEEAVTKLANSTSSYILYNFSGGFSWYLFGPDNRLQYDIAGTLGNGSWGYIVGTYDKDAGANNQRLYLNGTRVAQMRYREVEQGAFAASAGPASQGGRWRAPVLRTAAALTGRPRAGDGWQEVGGRWPPTCPGQPTGTKGRRLRATLWTACRSLRNAATRASLGGLPRAIRRS